MASLSPRVVAHLAVSLATAACIGAEIDDASEELIEVEESEVVADVVSPSARMSSVIASFLPP
ncbi:hypothetical protein [Sorangium sp. So ce542]|uniref:hypothetical protein n=1 Tax=Sorangium sp. So ce542 TaxID=3133316 RepID=UPI003F5DF9D3